MRQGLLFISGIIFCIQVAWIILVGRPETVIDGPLSSIPNFSLPSLDVDGITVSENDLAYQDIKLVNFFASWCGPCKVEHPLLMELEKANVDMLGIAFQDREENAKQFLDDTGNPYLLTALDENGTLGPNWEISSIPQTYVIDKNGAILYHKAGRLKREDLEQYILPIIRKEP